MKTTSFCAHCKAKRFYEVTCLSTADEALRRRCMLPVLKSISNAIETRDCPSFAGTVQSDIILEITGNRDPYRKKKREVIRRAKELYPKFHRWVEKGKTPYMRFKRALMVAVAGNTLELSAPNHKVNLDAMEKDMWKLVREKLDVDDAREIFLRIKKAKNVLYLCDNCGEAVFDKVLMNEIKKYAEVTAAVASVPLDEDVSLDEAALVGLEKVAPIIGKGRSYGVWKKRAPEKFWELLMNADLIIAKGMANYETLDEYKSSTVNRTCYLLRVKCEPVALSLGLEKGALIAKLV